MFYPLFPMASDRTSIDQRDQLKELCDNLVQPGFAIPAGADIQIAEALLSREVDRMALVGASKALLQSNPRVAEILDHAWTRNEAALHALFTDGTLLAFFNTELLQALLFTSPMPDLAMERLITFMRQQLLTSAVDANFQCDEAHHKCALAISAHMYLTEYAFFETPNESEKVVALADRIEKLPSDDIDSFGLALLASYRSLNQFEFIKHMDDTSLVASASQHGSEVSMKALWRTHVEEPSREKELALAMPQETTIVDPMSHTVRSQYEDNPYPRWVSYVRNDALPPVYLMEHCCTGVDLDEFRATGDFDVLVAGCGTGLAAIEEAVLWEGSNVLAIDLSRASLAFGRRCCDELGLTSVEFAQADLLEFGEAERSFSYIACSGVLHHLADPVEGWRSLLKVLRPGGVMRIGLYSELGRKSVKSASDFLKATFDGASPDSIRAARQSLIEHVFDNETVKEDLVAVFSNYDFYTTSMCRDLLFHAHEIDFTFPIIQSAIESLGLRFCGIVDPSGTLMETYRDFAPHDPKGLDLKSWTRFESQYPDSFVGMYDFMVQKPTS